MGGVCSLAAQRAVSSIDAMSLTRGLNDRSIGTATMRWSSDIDVICLFVLSGDLIIIGW